MAKEKERQEGNQHITTSDLGRLPVSKLLRYYAIPSVIGSVVNSLYNVVDRIFIGQGVNSLAISGLAVTFPILIFLQAFGVLVGVGAASRISILLGQKQKDKAENLLGNAFALSLITSISTIILIMVFLNDLLLSFGASEATLPYARDYLMVVIPGNVFANLTYSYNAVMRSTGYPRKAMITMIIGAVLNVILNPIFLFVFDMGIQGVAWATVISMFVTMIFVLQHFTDKRNLLNIKAKYFKLKWDYIKGILSIGIAPFAMHLTASTVNLIKNTSLLKYGGDYAIGAYGIVNSIAVLILMVVMGLSMGMQPVVGYNYGAGHMHRVREAYTRTVRINTFIGLMGTLLALFFPKILVMMFTTDQTMIDVTIPAVKIELAAMWVVGFQSTTGQFFQSIGAAWRSLVISLSRQVIFLIPMIYILPKFWGLTGVWIASPASDLLSGLISSSMLIYFARKNWRHLTN